MARTKSEPKVIVRPTLEERTKVLKNSTPAFQQMYDQMLANYNDESTNLIRSRYLQGKNVLELMSPESRKTYGPKSVAKMAYCLGEDRSYLQNCRRFAEVIEEDELEELIESRTAGNNAVTWSHVTVLFMLPDRESRDAALQHLLDNDLSFLAFREWVRAEFGASGKANNPGGRDGKKDKRPSTFIGFVENVSNDVGKILNQATDVWLKEDDSDPRTLKALFEAASKDNAIDKKAIQRAESVKNMCQAAAVKLLSLEREFSVFLSKVSSVQSQPSLVNSNISPNADDDNDDYIEEDDKREVSIKTRKKREVTSK